MKDGYPKDYDANMAWRKKILAKAAKDALFREKCKRLFFDDPLFAFNAFFFTYDPRKRPLHMQPFCTYDYQNEAILGLVDAINTGEDFLLEKSRDMGASWLTVLVFLWFWLNPSGGADFLVGSRKEEYVDKKGDMATLFEKIRYTLYRLPIWLRPEGFNREKNDRYMILTNPKTGASIRGESNNQFFASGGRFAAILFDEFAKWESTDESAWTSAGDASPCRLPISTPAGASGKYYDLAHGDVKKIRLHWTLHPEKALGICCEWPKEDHEETKLRSIWYDEQCERRTQLEIDQELDINYLGAGNPVFDGKAGKSLAWYRAKGREPREWFRIDPDTGELTQAGNIPRYPEGYLAVYWLPDKRLSYTIGVDVAEGKVTGDLSIVKVYCRETNDVVATYFAHIDERRLAFVVKEIGAFFGSGSRNPWIGIEVNGPGLSTFDKCVELDVPNLFMMPNYDTTKNAVTYQKGWKTGPSSRKMLIGGIKEFLNDRQGHVDLRCVGELGTFCYNKNGRPEAKAGCHDDEVIAFGICIQVDLMAPQEGTYKEAIKIRSDGLPETVVGEGFDLEALKVEDEPKSLQERCLRQAIQRHSERLKPNDKDFYAEVW